MDEDIGWGECRWRNPDALDEAMARDDGVVMGAPSRVAAAVAGLVVELGLAPEPEPEPGLELELVLEPEPELEPGLVLVLELALVVVALAVAVAEPPFAVVAVSSAAAVMPRLVETTLAYRLRSSAFDPVPDLGQVQVVVAVADGSVGPRQRRVEGSPGAIPGALGVVVASDQIVADVVDGREMGVIADDNCSSV